MVGGVLPPSPAAPPSRTAMHTPPGLTTASPEVYDIQGRGQTAPTVHTAVTSAGRALLPVLAVAPSFPNLQVSWGETAITQEKRTQPFPTQKAQAATCAALEKLADAPLRGVGCSPRAAPSAAARAPSCLVPRAEPLSWPRQPSRPLAPLAPDLLTQEPPPGPGARTAPARRRRAPTSACARRARSHPSRSEQGLVRRAARRRRPRTRPAPSQCARLRPPPPSIRADAAARGPGSAPRPRPPAGRPRRERGRRAAPPSRPAESLWKRGRRVLRHRCPSPAGGRPRPRRRRWLHYDSHSYTGFHPPPWSAPTSGTTRDVT